VIQIRAARIADAEAITALLDALGYPGTEAFIQRRMVQLIEHHDESLLVAVNDARVAGVISLHFIPQLALAGDICRISYFCVDEQSRGDGIGALLEAHAAALAKTRGCDRMELHCHARRTGAHRFYERQGYVESPRYYVKSLVDM